MNFKSRILKNFLRITHYASRITVDDRRESTGVTLIELVIVITVASALVGGAALFITRIIDTWTFVSFRNDEVAQGRMALDRMIKEIRLTKDIYSVTAATSDTFTFTDINNNNISFVLSGTDIVRSSDILVSNISNLEFKYYDINNNELTPPVVTPSTNIWVMAISFTIERGDETLTLQSQVHPRSFSL